MMLLLLVACTICVGSTASASVFDHPAGWHTRGDIARVRSLIASGREPWKSAVELLMNDTSLTSGYQPAPVSLVCRTCCDVACCAPGESCPGASSGSMERDGIAAYYLMLRWVASNETACPAGSYTYSNGTLPTICLPFCSERLRCAVCL